MQPIIEYCPQCERETTHIYVNDEVFESGLECTICGYVSEAELPDEE